MPDIQATAVSVRTVVAEKWMDRFVLDLVECPSVSRTSAVAWTFGPAVSEEYSPVFFCWGGEVADAYPLVVVESDTARVSGLQLVESDTAQISVLPVAGCKFPAVFLGKVALGCGWSGRWPAVSPSGLGGNLADFDRRASPIGSCSPGRNPGG